VTSPGNPTPKTAFTGPASKTPSVMMPRYNLGMRIGEPLETPLITITPIEEPVPTLPPCIEPEPQPAREPVREPVPA
jgi:hypothetical protein